MIFIWCIHCCGGNNIEKSEIVGVKKNMVDDIHVWDIEDVKMKYIFPVPVSSAENVSQDQTKPVS